MIFFIFSSILIVSPDTVTGEYFDITMVFDPPLKSPYGEFLLDGEKIEGELETDYFYYEVSSPLKAGKHTITAIAGGDSVRFAFRVVSEINPEGNAFLNYISFGIGYEFNTAPETLSFTTYPHGRFTLLSGDIDIEKGRFHLVGTYIKDPEYPLGWYGIFDIVYRDLNISSGTINPVYDELTLYSPYGVGVDLNYKWGRSKIDVVLMNSSAYDTLISEYTRNIVTGKVNIESTFVFTFLRAEDDTASFKGIPAELPQSGFIASGMLNLKYRNVYIYGKIASSKGVFNMYIPEEVKGISFETGLRWHDILFYYRRVDSLYLPLGNPYLDKDRRIGIDGSGRKNIFSFQISGYLLKNGITEINGYNFSANTTVGREWGVNLGIQGENIEGSRSFSFSSGGFLYRDVFSLITNYTGSWTSGYGLSHSISGSFNLNLSPILMAFTISYTSGEEGELSLSFTPTLNLSMFQIFLEYRAILSATYRETSIKTMVKFIK